MFYRGLEFFNNLFKNLIKEKTVAYNKKKKKKKKKKNKKKKM